MRLFDILKRNELNAPDLDKLNVMSHKTLYATFGEPMSMYDVSGITYIFNCKALNFQLK